MRKLLLVIAAMGLTACSYYQPVSNPSGTLLQAVLPAEKYTIIGTATGESCARFLFGFPLATATGEKNSYQAAVRKAIQSRNGDHFIQATADFAYTGFPLPQYAIYQDVCVTVEGLVIKFK